MLNPIIIIANGVAIALSLAFALIMTWYDVRRHIYQYFIALLIFFIAWHLGSLATQFLTLLDFDRLLTLIAQTVHDIGFMGTNIMIYVLTMNLTGIRSNRFHYLIILTLSVLIAWTIFFLIIVYINETDINSINLLIYTLFSLTSAYILWRHYKKVTNKWLVLSIAIVLVGQGSHFINPAINDNVLSITISAVGVIMFSVALIQQEIIAPLKNRGKQIEYMHRISISLTKRTNTKAIFQEITKQITDWLEADAAMIFIAETTSEKQQYIKSEAVYNLPYIFADIKNPIDKGIAGKTIQTGKSIRLNNYDNDWKDTADFPINHHLIGSVISAPLRFEDKIYGALLVISGKDGRSFSKEDEYLAEMLASQAALSISQAHLFTEQTMLTHQLEQTLNQLTTVLESTENPVLAVDRQFRLIFANRATEKILTSASMPLLGKTIGELLDINHIQPPSYRAVHRAIKKFHNFSYEFSLANRDYLCHITSLGTERVEGWVIIVNDISELKELDRIKSEMIRMTSHDLKNPLQAALANIDLLREDLNNAKNNDSHQQELLLSVHNIEHELIKMQRIISGILDLERVRLAKANFEDKDINQILEDTVNEVTSFARDKDITIKTSLQKSSITITCDPQQIQRAMVNLLDNAIKFSKPFSTVTLSCTRNKKYVTIAVQDNGIGIPVEIQPYIFERFYRGGQAGAEHVTGSGLGLSLVKAVIQAHNGAITVHSNGHSGTSFSIQLPVSD